jgi:hypothetical protein
MRRLVAAAMPVAVILVLAGQAAAGTASLNVTYDRYGKGYASPVYLASRGEANDLRLSFDLATSAFVVTDSAGVSPTRLCPRPEPGDPKRVTCPVGADTYADPGVVILGDKDDRAVAPGQQVEGGPGDDRIEQGAIVLPGAGNDTMVDPSVVDFGREGDGSDAVIGTLPSSVSYVRRRRPVSVTLDGRRNDGSHGERDQIGREVKVVSGGRGADRLVGNGATNELSGGGGRNVIIGGGGGDNLYGGRDRDRLSGGAGRDTILGGFGADVIVGGPGRDTLTAGGGDDLVRARDGAVDEVACGYGRDTAVVDEFDFTKTTCERIRRRGAPRAVPLHASVTDYVDSPTVTAQVGCPADSPRSCTGTLELSAGGHSLGSKRFRSRPGRFAVLDFYVSYKVANSAALIRLTARSRTGAGRRRAVTVFERLKRAY